MLSSSSFSDYLIWKLCIKQTFFRKKTNFSERNQRRTFWSRERKFWNLFLISMAKYTENNNERGLSDTMMQIKNNPISERWFADPEAKYYEGEYWIYVTNSLPYEEQKNITVLHSKNLTDWEICEDIIDMTDYPEIWQAVWAPTIIEKNGKYYLIFACNDIQSDAEIGGLQIAVSDSPKGPFKRYTDLLINRFIHGTQPIDAHLFMNDDGIIYLYYGGWRHCNVCMMNETMDGFVPFEDGTIYKEITPFDYVEGPCMLKRNEKYYFMWSCGSWRDGTYCVRYAVSDSPLGPFEQSEEILKSDETTATGPGHNSYLYLEEKDLYFIIYHRHKPEEKDGNARYLCIDSMKIENDKILPVKMT